MDEKNCAKPKIESIWQDVNKVDYDMARQVERITDIANAFDRRNHPNDLLLLLVCLLLTVIICAARISL